MESNVLQRITKYCSTNNLSNNRMSVSIGIGQKTVNNYMNGSRKVSYEFIEAIIRTFEDINPEWLLTGKGEMLKTRPSPIDAISATVQGGAKGSVVGGGVLNNGNINGNGNHVGIVPADCEKELMKSQCETDYLKKEIKSLKEQLKKAESDRDRAIIDKDKAMDMLHKALSK